MMQTSFANDVINKNEKLKVLKKEFSNKLEIPIIMSSFKDVIPAHPEGFSKKGWFTNDHSFVEDKNGKLHWFGINNPYPPKGKRLYRYHPYLGHMSTSTPLKKWTRHKWAIDESKGTEYVGAPAVVWHDKEQKYVMVVETWLKGKRRLEVCWSKNLMDWQRTYKPILPNKLWYTTRDPQIIKKSDGNYWIILASTGAEGKNGSQVIRLETKDFKKFSDPKEIFNLEDNAKATYLESPFIVYRPKTKLWYLFFTYAHRKYAETFVIVSKNPDKFELKNTLATLFSHAAEIFSYKGKTYISTCGPEDRHSRNTQATALAELEWIKP